MLKLIIVAIFPVVPAVFLLNEIKKQVLANKKKGGAKKKGYTLLFFWPLYCILKSGRAWKQHSDGAAVSLRDEATVLICLQPSAHAEISGFDFEKHFKTVLESDSGG